MLSLVDRGADLLGASGTIGEELVDALKDEARRRVVAGASSATSPTAVSWRASASRARAEGLLEVQSSAEATALHGHGWDHYTAPLLATAAVTSRHGFRPSHLARRLLPFA